MPYGDACAQEPVGLHWDPVPPSVLPGPLTPTAQRLGLPAPYSHQGTCSRLVPEKPDSIAHLDAGPDPHACSFLEDTGQHLTPTQKC